MMDAKATSDKANQLTRNQRLAIFYKRRERFEKWMNEDKELHRIIERVHLLEVNCNMYFDKVQFYNEVANPRLCTMIDDIF